MSPNDPWIGEQIGDGRYQIRARVGQGNMGQVFRAWDRNLATEFVSTPPPRPPRPIGRRRRPRAGRSLAGAAWRSLRPLAWSARLPRQTG